MMNNRFNLYLIIIAVLLVSIFIGSYTEKPVIYIIVTILSGAVIFLTSSLYVNKRLLTELEQNFREKISIIKEMEDAFNKKSSELILLYQQSKHNEDQLRETIESAVQGITVLTLEGSFIRVNSAICDMIGYTEEDLLRTDLQCITHPDDFVFDMVNMKSLETEKIQSYKLEKRLYHSAGITIWVMQYMKLIKEADGCPLHLVAHYIDITERKQAEEQLKKYTETLTVLLREVNHRVKNNLAALISMLHMEQKKATITKNLGYINFLNDLISRIQSLSTVHSMLSAQNWQPLELSQLCSKVIQAAISGTPPGKKVTMNVSKNKIKVNSNQSHHLTLVINELTTNSVKHAMNDREEATISVNISAQDDFVQIIFKDDGPGFPQALIEGDFTRANIGFELIRGIVLQSLDGEFRLENNNGATAIIKFENELVPA